jgi:hypothetical protein
MCNDNFTFKCFTLVVQWKALYNIKTFTGPPFVFPYKVAILHLKWEFPRNDGMLTILQYEDSHIATALRLHYYWRSNSPVLPKMSIKKSKVSTILSWVRKMPCRKICTRTLLMTYSAWKRLNNVFKNGAIKLPK